jgi:fused signal recognition particle receptor
MTLPGTEMAMSTASVDPMWLMIGVAIAVVAALVVIVLRRGKGADTPEDSTLAEKAEPGVAARISPAARKEQFATTTAAEPAKAPVKAAELRPVATATARTEPEPEPDDEEAPPSRAVEPDDRADAQPAGWELEDDDEVEAPAATQKPQIVHEKPRLVEEKPAATSLREGLGKTRREGFVARLGRLFGSKTLDSSLVDEIEEALFTADVGVKTVDRMMEGVRAELGSGSASADAVWGIMRRQAREILDTASRNERGTQPGPGEPRVIMVLGVNGAGKTTTIGKLAHQLAESGTKTALVAGDTFRAAAAEQLEHWGRRVGAKVYRGEEGADPASVVFDGVKQARADGMEVVLVDTAGRLHTQVNLMEELKKVRRVMGKALDGCPHEVLLIVDATTGQNAIQQAAMFDEACQVSGVVLTKLDGTARGGIVIGVCDQLGIPIRYIGVGERVDDLRAFSASEFVDALFAL